MRPSLLLVALLLAGSGLPAHLVAQTEAELRAVNRVLDLYAATEEAGDMAAQARLMTADRVLIGASGRRTDHAASMRLQQMTIEEGRKFAPGTRYVVEARERLVRFYGGGTVAVASFFWHVGAVRSGDLSVEKRRLYEQQPSASIVTAVLVKDGGGWKIAHTHYTTTQLRGY